MSTPNRCPFGSGRRPSTFRYRSSSEDPPRQTHSRRPSTSYSSSRPTASTSETPTAHRPQGRSAPPADRSGSRESSRPSKRRRGSECSPHRSECRVQVHVHSPFVEHRGRRACSPQCYPTERSYAHSPRAPKPSHTHRPTTEPPNDAWSPSMKDRWPLSCWPLTFIQVSSIRS